MMMLNKGAWNGVRILQESTVLEMHITNWLNDGSDGDTDGDLF